MKMKVSLLVLLLLTILFAQQIIVEYGLPEVCAKYEDCQPYICNPVTSKCDNCTVAPVQCPTGYCDAETGRCSPCTAHAQCATALCDVVTGYCKSCTSNEDCAPSTGLCDVATGKCVSCISDAECPTRLCVGGKCIVCAKDADCRTQPYLNCRAGPPPFTGICRSCGPPDDAGCLYDWRCNAETGACECLPAGSACTTSAACCSGLCAGGRCTIPIACPVGRYDPASQSCVCDPGDLVCLGILGGGATSEGRRASAVVAVATKPPEVIPVQKVVAVPIVTEAIFRIFGFEPRPAALERCYKGAPCTTAADCCDAPCTYGRCAASRTICVASGDCYEGYCEGGLCKSPPRMGLFLETLLRKPAEVGCVGIVECLPGQAGCIHFCSAITAILAVVAVGVGAAIFKVTGNALYAGAGITIPAAMALVTYPFIGAIVGIILIALIIAR